VSAPTAAATASQPPATNLLEAYLAHVDALPIGSGSRAVRRRGAKLLTQRHPDLQAWMGRPAPARVAELHRIEAWPFVIWCAVTGRVRADVELLLAKPGGVELASVWDAAHPGDIRRAAEVGRLLGWSENWTRQVIRHALPVLCTWAAKSLDELADDELSRFIDEVERAAFLSESARYRVHTRLFAMGQVLFQLGVVSHPPRPFNRSPARTPDELAALVPQPAVRREVVRYAQTIGTVLRPATAYARIKAIRVFCDWLADHHPDVGRLDQLARTSHLEPFIAWSRTRPWRGANGRGRTISLRQFHHDLVDLRVFFEDIAAWGWPTQPLQRLLFLADLPRVPEPMPRALPPVTDAALMGAVRRLEDPLARTGLIVLRATGMRVGELLDLELDCLVDFGRHGTWLRVPVGKLGTERTVPLDQPTLDVIDVDEPSRPAARSASPAPRRGGSLRVHGARTPGHELAAGQGPRPGRGHGRAHAPGRFPGALHPPPTPPYVRHKPCERRHLAACPHVPHGTRDARDDPSVCPARLTDHPHRVRGGDGEGPRSHPSLDPTYAYAGRSQPRGLAGLGDAQDQGRPRLLLP
jgi:integrase